MIPTYHPFIKAVAHGLRYSCAVEPGDRLLVAVSGGADSVALLRALAVLAPRRRWRLGLAVGHVQHHLRTIPDAETGVSPAEVDARFVQNLAEALEWPFFRADLDLSDANNRSGGGAGGGNLEAVARRRRYAALDALADSAGCPAVVVGHHADDQLETLLMRMLRGASIRGLRGMAWRRPVAAGCERVLLRPMLGTDRAAVITFLRELNQPWREDHTNADVAHWRARLRNEVLPVLRDLRPAAAAKAVQLADDCRRAYRVLRRDARALSERATVSSSPDRVVFQRGPLRKAPSIVCGELLRHQLADLGARRDSMGRRSLQPLLRAIHDGDGGTRRFYFAPGIVVMLTRESLDIHREE